MSRLTERLVAAEGELAQLKCSCQFTALAEMLSAGEEYANEVNGLVHRVLTYERKNSQWTDHLGPQQNVIVFSNNMSLTVTVREFAQGRYNVFAVRCLYNGEGG